LRILNLAFRFYRREKTNLERLAIPIEELKINSGQYHLTNKPANRSVAIEHRTSSISAISSSSGCDPSPRAGSWVVHGYPFEDVANAKIVAHLVGLLRRMETS
jgi:hypothetical protein